MYIQKITDIYVNDINVLVVRFLVRRQHCLGKIRTQEWEHCMGPHKQHTFRLVLMLSPPVSSSVKEQTVIPTTWGFENQAKTLHTHKIAV